MPTNDRKYMREYMRRKRAEGKIKHWRQYKLEKKKLEKLKKQTRKAEEIKIIYLQEQHLRKP